MAIPVRIQQTGLVAPGKTSQMLDEPDERLISHLVRTTSMPSPLVRRVVAEVISYYSEPVDDFVRRRHGELRSSGLTNPDIFEALAKELEDRRFPAPPLSERQLRRVVYG